MGLKERFTQFAHAWNAFSSKDTTTPDWSVGTSSRSYFSYAPYRKRMSTVNSKTIIAPILNRIALDCAGIDIKHCRVDATDPDRYLYDMTTNLNRCMTLEANRDQSAADFWLDVFLSLLDEGDIAIIPTDTSLNPQNSNAFDINEMRVGKVKTWRPLDVLVNAYDPDRGEHRDLWMPKRAVAIVQNPFYAVMNDGASLLSRLSKKLALIDVIDESGAGKLDMIIQLPYAIKNETRREQAEKRRESLEAQLNNNKLGIGYIDSTEKITTLNRSLENNLLEQVKYLTELLYSQLGITIEIMNGTASEEVMLNYMNRTIAPIVTAVTMEMTRKFISKTAYTQGQRIKFFSDPFKLVSMQCLSDITDKLTRNEIASSNEVRTKFLGWKPVDSPQADELRNKNLNLGEGQSYATTSGEQIIEKDLPAEQDNSAELGLKQAESELKQLEQLLKIQQLLPAEQVQLQGEPGSLESLVAVLATDTDGQPEAPMQQDVPSMDAALDVLGEDSDGLNDETDAQVDQVIDEIIEELAK